MSTQKIKSFNSIVKSFLLQMAPHLGTSYHYYFNQMLRVNAVAPIEQFVKFAIPLRDNILSKNEQFFLDDKNYEQYVKKEDSKSFVELLRLKDVWGELDEKSKENVWKIFQALLILSEEYLNLKLGKTKN